MRLKKLIRKYKQNLKFNSSITFNSKKESLPYNGIIVRAGINIYVFGNEIDGDIAALRKLVDNQEFYFSKAVTERIDYISEEDLDGLFVFDYLHTDENQAKYRKNNANFAKVVENVLNSDVSTLAIKRVLTTNDNTSLRIKHVNAELGPKYKNFSIIKPVVISAGIFNNLFTFEDFGFELARGTRSNKIRDTWLIEITGGPNTECSTCPNYKYEDLVDFYWPALISGIEKYSNQNKIDYVGHSNACRTALDSLKNWSSGKSNAGYYNNGTDWVLTNLSANVVENFVGVACPGAFEGSYETKRLISLYGDKAITNLLDKGKTHLTKRDFQIELCNQAVLIDKLECLTIVHALPKLFPKFFGEVTNDTISINLLDYYVGIINSSSDTQPGSGVTVNNFAIFHGTLLNINNSDTYDNLVSSVDIKAIYNNINSQNKKQFQIPFASHSGILNRDTTRRLIAKTLNNESLTSFERFWYLERES